MNQDLNRAILFRLECVQFWRSLALKGRRSGVVRQVGIDGMRAGLRNIREMRLAGHYIALAYPTEEARS